ncbi:hypothetical protein IKG13_01790 [Candidatus Saccharibacteria bacterium]|nr:hypothetical protein [Candidatus Saccharibacteria bacterium]MBR3378476.1 hypothetical protein [Candidatus Saccharibacteria bacterium]
MRFYPGGAFDSQGRLNIKSYAPLLTGRTVMVYTTDDNFDLIHVDSYDGKPGVPECAIRKIDDKGRFVCPKVLRRDADYALVSVDTPGKIVLKLMWNEGPG